MRGEGRTNFGAKLESGLCDLFCCCIVMLFSLQVRAMFHTDLKGGSLQIRAIIEISEIC